MKENWIIDLKHRFAIASRQDRLSDMVAVDYLIDWIKERFIFKKDLFSILSKIKEETHADAGIRALARLEEELKK